MCEENPVIHLPCESLITPLPPAYPGLPKVLPSVFRVTKVSIGGYQDVYKMHLGILETLGGMRRRNSEEK